MSELHPMAFLLFSMLAIEMYHLSENILTSQLQCMNYDLE